MCAHLGYQCPYICRDASKCKSQGRKARTYLADLAGDCIREFADKTCHKANLRKHYTSG